MIYCVNKNLLKIKKLLYKPLIYKGAWLPRQGSNLDSPDPESGVLPVTPQGIILKNFVFQPTTCGPDESRTHDL